jgi:hypothetical protein
MASFTKEENDYVTLPSSYAHIFFDFYLFLSASDEKCDGKMYAK